MNLELQNSDELVGILTPDQRLRVFVSSTLQEMSDERKSVRLAIEALGLTPVMFEQGARPHPPQKLYRAYLAKSHIFIGIYWQSYGLVAPDELVSGLEDEYQLSGDLPKLIYVKKSTNRDPKLQALLARIKADDRVSYKSFATARELRTLLKNDLALMLSERFTAQDPQPALEPSPLTNRGNIPWPASPIIGREHDRRQVLDLILRDDVHLVTLTGTGGIGKTRLALDIAHRLQGNFADGVYFIALAAISDANLVPDAIARAIGAFEVDGRSALEACKARLRDQKTLLVLDNFEQVLSAVSVVSELLVAAPGLKVLATSRASLNLSGEWDYPVQPLTLPDRESATSLLELSTVDAIQLFVARARTVRPDFELNADNAADIAAITMRLDGLPLAIELAAARMRILSPKALLARLENRLNLLTGGYRDLPERQRTLRNTIDWSFNLLEPEERRLFTCLGVFVGGFSLEASETICHDPSCCDIFEQVQSLVDKNLVTTLEPAQRFGMLETMREYAVEKLAHMPDEKPLHQKHAAYFLSLAETASARMHGPDQLQWLSVVEREYTNIRAAIEWSLESGDMESVAAFGLALWYYWYVRGRNSEGLAWMQRALPRATTRFAQTRILLTASVMLGRQGKHEESLSYIEKALPILEKIGENDGQILAHLTIAYAAAGLSRAEQARSALETSLQMAESTGPDWIIPHIFAGLARVEASIGNYDKAVTFAEQSRARQKPTGDPSIASFALITLATIRLLRRETDLAAEQFSEGLDFAESTENPNLTASSIEGLCAVAVVREQYTLAARLWGTARRLRETVSVPLLQMEDRIYAPLLAEARLKLGDAAFSAAVDEGRGMTLQKAIDLTRIPIGPATTPRQHSAAQPI